MNKYELIVIFLPSVVEVKIKSFEDNYLNKILDAKIIKIEKLGKKTLSYEMKKSSEGIYYIYHFEANPGKAIIDFKNRINIDPDVIRIMLLKVKEFTYMENINSFWIKKQLERKAEKEEKAKKDNNLDNIIDYEQNSN